MVCDSFPDMVSFLKCAGDTVFGGSWEILTIACFIVIALLAYKARLNPTLSMVLAWSLTYAFYLASGGSSWLEFIFAILTLGLAVRMTTAIIEYFRK